MSICGKILSVSQNGFVIARGYSIITTSGESFKILDSLYSKLSRHRLLSRFFRVEITRIYSIFNDEYLAIAKKGLFIQRHGANAFAKCFSILRGSKPLNICVIPSGNIFWGEYFQNTKKDVVYIYESVDHARTWRIVYTFPRGSINHIHGLFFDPYTQRIWVTTGDRENECIIGYTEDEFQTFTEVFRGGQEYRTCQLFFFRDYIVFGTDTQYERNVIKCFDRRTLEITFLQEVQGSIIKGGQVGDVAFVSTSVEPSKVNKDRYAHLWVTKDGIHWEERFKAKKDCWPSIMQFGTFEFPNYECDKIDKLYFSGRSLKGWDGKSSYIEI